MTTIKEEIEQLNNEHWDGIIALASKAENADDLNSILGALEKLHNYIHGPFPGFSGQPFVDAISQIEDTVTQWETTMLPDYGNVFRKDENTVIAWNEYEGTYVEYEEVA